MPKQDFPEAVPLDDSAHSAFDAQFARVFEAAECRTQIELADVLEVRQSSVSDAKRRKSIPAEWRMKLFEKKRINPEWILRGDGAKYLVPAGTGHGQPQLLRLTEIRPPQECTSQELINELVRRALLEPDFEAMRKDAATLWTSRGMAKSYGT
jgi:hypothetical protein